jgi:hypothetical protein
MEPCPACLDSRFVEHRDYNVDVASSPQRAPQGKRPKHHAYALETTGLLLIAVLLLVLTLVRYWAYISWSAR